MKGDEGGLSTSLCLSYANNPPSPIYIGDLPLTGEKNPSPRFIHNKCAYNEVQQGGRAVLHNIGLGIYFSIFRYIGIIWHTKRINKKSRGIFPAFTHFSSFKTRSFVSRTFNSRSACSFFRLNSFSSNFISHLDFSSKSFLPHFVFSS